jgi:hypothetical protein
MAAPPSRRPKPAKDTGNQGERGAATTDSTGSPTAKTRYGEGWQTNDKSSAVEESPVMAERWALGPSGYSKLLSDLKQRIQTPPNCARTWIMHTGTLSDAWPCPLDATQGASERSVI